MERQQCPRCGAEVRPDDLQGLCPPCLLEGALQTESEPTGGAQPEGDPIERALEEKLRSQYRIVRMLGRGGMGAVYLARDLTLDREVAIKVVSAGTDSRALYDRFRREAKTAAKLSHPNIVPLHAFGEVEGMPYFVMGYVRGESLAARLRRQGRLREDEALRVMGEIAQALDHAHRLGVIHRDVKPDNVLLDDETGRALLTDFGVAKAADGTETLTQAGGIIGTPHYMSPEQAAGHAVDARSDIYSLGVMGYAMLSGRLPFEGSTAADILTKHLTQQPPSLRLLAPALPDTTVRTVERCLAKDPAARWQDARSLAQTLGTTEPHQLPESLSGVEGHGILALLLGLLGLDVMYFALAKAVAALRDVEGIRLLALVPIESATANVIFVLGVWSLYYALVIRRLRREGFPASQSHRVIWTEPRWWLFWYPAALRRRGNVWDRLPARVRHFRSWTAFVGSIVVFGELVFSISTMHGLTPLTRSIAIRQLIRTSALATIAALIVVWFILRIRAMHELTRTDLDAPDVFRVLISVPPSRLSFWTRPHIASILAPAARAEIPRSDAPHDHLQSILRDGNDLSGPLRPLGAEAAVAARQLIAAMEEDDRQVAALMRNIEPGEEERLVDKIEALAGEESAPLRVLLEKQRELIHDLAGRVEKTKARRNRRVEMLKTLSLHVASLRARVTEAPSEIAQISDNVRALCEQIGTQSAAADVTNGEPTMQKG